MAKRASKSATKKAARKVATRKTAARRAVTKKSAVRKKPATKKAIARKKIVRLPPGYSKLPSGILIPGENYITPSSKLRAGLISARDEINKSLEEIVAVMTQDYEISEIEVSVSFSADGKFLGFGVGGASTIKVKIRPSEQNT